MFCPLILAETIFTLATHNRRPPIFALGVGVDIHMEAVVLVVFSSTPPW